MRCAWVETKKEYAMRRNIREEKLDDRVWDRWDEKAWENSRRDRWKEKK